MAASLCYPLSFPSLFLTGNQVYNIFEATMIYKVLECVCTQAKLLQSCLTLLGAHQTLLSMGYSRQEYWSELPFPPPGDFPTQGITPASLTSPVLAGRFFTTSAIQEAHEVLFSSVQFSRSVVSDSLRPHESQHARPPCPSPTPGVHSDSHPWSR